MLPVAIGLCVLTVLTSILPYTNGDVFQLSELASRYPLEFDTQLANLGIELSTGSGASAVSTASDVVHALKAAPVIATSSCRTYASRAHTVVRHRLQAYLVSHRRQHTQSHRIPSHPIPSHPIPPHPIPTHPTPSHPIPHLPLRSLPRGSCWYFC